MYLHELIIHNSGPLKQINFDFEFRLDGSPKPLLLVGSNGSGKTTVLSTVADGILEIAATHFADVAPPLGMGHKFYRLLGGSTVHMGSTYELSLMKFLDATVEYRVAARSGTVDPAVLMDVEQRFPEINRIQGNGKLVSQPQDQVEAIFRAGVYAFFPSSRSEIPHWAVERSSNETGDFKVVYENALAKPIIVQSALDSLKPWLLDLLLDALTDTSSVLNASNLEVLKSEVRERSLIPFLALNDINAIIREITGFVDAHLVRTGRFSADKKLQIARTGNLVIPMLEALSAGQISLFIIFATLVRYADLGRLIDPNKQITGIVCIDEAEAHLHSSLQYHALPNLIAMFPRVQFIISSHSPLFALGMKNKFSEGGFTLLNMPDGKHIPVERYDDFLNAFMYFEHTETFERKIEELSRICGRPLILCEGETDPRYLLKAAQVLGFCRLTHDVEIDWVGTNATGGAKGGGKNNLNDAWKFLTNNPSLVNRQIVLLYDADAQKPEVDEGRLHIRTLQTNPLNDQAKGVENLLPVEVLEDRFYHDERSLSGTTQITKRILDKSGLCSHLCETAESKVFEGFRTSLVKLDQLLFPDAKKVHETQLNPKPILHDIPSGGQFTN
jgi:hypothetical protein